MLAIKQHLEDLVLRAKGGDAEAKAALCRELRLQMSVMARCTLRRGRPNNPAGQSALAEARRLGSLPCPPSQEPPESLVLEVTERLSGLIGTNLTAAAAAGRGAGDTVVGL